MPDEILQPIQQVQDEPIPSENPVPPEPAPVSDNIPEVPLGPTLPEEIQTQEPIPTSEIIPTQEIPKTEQAPEISTDLNNPNITIEKTPDTVTITEIIPARHDAESVGEPKAPVSESSKSDLKIFLASLLPKLKEKLFFRTEQRLSKIMELARKNGEIQNDEIEKLLHVSDASATRYLEKLVKRGSLRVSGPKNHAKYVPN